jgi:hypothetical protein
MKASQQLSLFHFLSVTADPPASHDAGGGDRKEAARFVHAGNIDRSGPAAYVHLIRSAADPERSPRPSGGREDRAPHRTLKKTTVEYWQGQIRALLDDGISRTFNRIGVELLDQTADMLLGSPVDAALWSLVKSGNLEHTTEIPILFRISG